MLNTHHRSLHLKNLFNIVGIIIVLINGNQLFLMASQIFQMESNPFTITFALPQYMIHPSRLSLFMVNLFSLFFQLHSPLQAFPFMMSLRQSQHCSLALGSHHFVAWSSLGCKSETGSESVTSWITLAKLPAPLWDTAFSCYLKTLSVPYALIFVEFLNIEISVLNIVSFSYKGNSTIFPHVLALTVKILLFVLI